MKKLFYKISLLVCATVFIISALLIVKHYIEAEKSIRDFKRLQDMINQTTEMQVANMRLTAQASRSFDAYDALYAQNPDLIGWIKIEGTNINYPVMQRKDEPLYYLYRNFDEEYSDAGIPFLDVQSDWEKPSDNLLFHGHHMKNGTMFADLVKYKDESFWQERPIIQFDTIHEPGRYEIIGALKTQVYTDDPNAFRYFEFVDAKNESDFDAYISRVKEEAFYDTGVSATYGDKIITLSTCEYSLKDGRMVVVAKKIIETEN